ncbi:hypothetical protein OF83DRAFT_852458 [Amylostereum chailletii]|nr:hypothetical protein OF83DRAFT_852458 [Amylostereum chailletii]
MSKKGSKAPKDTSYEYRDVVLAKVRGYPPWPGMVVDPSSLNSDVLKERPSNKKANFYCVRFFPKGDHAWLVSKDISRLLLHEIQAYVNEPFKKSGELLEGYRIALDPTKWEAEFEAERAQAAEEEANAEVDQLDDAEADGDADGDDDDKPKPKKRKRDSEAASSKAKSKAKVKKGSSEPASAASKKKAPTKGRKSGGNKSKDTVESEDDGERAEADEDAGPSKHTSPPPTKKAKREKDEGPLAKDPQAALVKDWRHKLQKTFLSDNKDPKPEDMPGCDELFKTIEQYENMNIDYLAYSKIGKVMRHIHLQPQEKIPRDDEFNFRLRAKALVDKWSTIADVKESEPKTNGAPKEEAVDDKFAPAEQNTDDKMEEEVKTDAEAALPDAGDASMLADVTMSEA